MQLALDEKALDDLDLSLILLHRPHKHSSLSPDHGLLEPPENQSGELQCHNVT